MGCISRVGRGIAMSGMGILAVVGWGTSATADTAVFQEGLNGYAGTVDTYIRGYAPTSEYSGLASVKWDGDDGGGLPNFVLLRFENIFGSGAGQVPAGAIINSATLTYEVFNSGNNATVNEVAVSWAETVTYNTFGGDAGVQTDEYGSEVGTAPGSIGNNTLDVTSSLASWSGNPGANLGWIFRPTGGTDGVEFRSSEDATAATRPKLTVNYSVVTAVDITPGHIDAVVGEDDGSVTVSIPPGSNDTQAVQVTLTTDNAAVAGTGRRERQRTGDHVSHGWCGAAGRGDRHRPRRRCDDDDHERCRSGQRRTDGARGRGCGEFHADLRTGG